MAEIWGRELRIVFGVPGGRAIEVDTSKIEGNYHIPQITFNISKSIVSKNTASISLYNLRKSSRELVSKSKRNSLFCELYAGYEGKSFLIFKGNVQSGGSVWKGSEWVTTLNTVDDVKDPSKKINKSYKGTTNIKKVMEDTIGKTKNALKGVIQDVKDDYKQNGVTVSGTMTKVLDDLVKKIPHQNLEVSIQEQTPIIKPANKMLNPNTIVEVRFDTGLIGTPVKTQTGVSFKCVIQKGINPLLGVKLVTNSTDYSGIYIIQKVTYSGATRGSDWSIKVTANSADSYKEAVTG